MTLDPKNIAERLGAADLSQAPDVEGGAFGMAHLAEVTKQRHNERGGRRQGWAIGWVLSSKVPISAETEKLLIALAKKMSTPEQCVNPTQLAAQLLEESVQRLAKDQTQ